MLGVRCCRCRIQFTVTFYTEAGLASCDNLLTDGGAIQVVGGEAAGRFVGRAGASCGKAARERRAGRDEVAQPVFGPLLGALHQSWLAVFFAEGGLTTG